MRRLGLLGLSLLATAGATLASAPPAGPTVEVQVSKRGFEPFRITLRRGETAQIVLRAGDGEHCFAIDELRIEKRIVAGRATRFDLTPERAGSFPFYCCLESGEAAEIERGVLTVGE